MEEKWEVDLSAELPEEVALEMFPADDPYPCNMAEAKYFAPQHSEDEEIELPRGAAGDLLSHGEGLHHHHHNHLATLQPVHKPKNQLAEVEEDPTVKKTRVFIEAVKKDGEWARSLESVRLSVQNNAHLTKDTLKDFFHHLFTKINNRPKVLVISSKLITLDDIGDMLKLIFTPQEDMEPALIYSMVRVQAKNATTKLKPLAKCISAVCESLPGVEVECDDICALLTRNGATKKFRTSDLKSYFRLEDHCQSLGLRVQASFCIRQVGVPGMDVMIRWYDEVSVRDSHTRSTYVHLDHSVRKNAIPHVAFSTEPPKVIPFDVPDGSKLLPASLAGTSVTDLIGFLTKTMVGRHNL